MRSVVTWLPVAQVQASPWDTYSTKKLAEGLINSLNDSYSVVAANRRELNAQMNPTDTYAYDDPIATVTTDDDYNENTFLEGIEE